MKAADQEKRSPVHCLQEEFPAVSGEIELAPRDQRGKTIRCLPARRNPRRNQQENAAIE